MENALRVNEQEIEDFKKYFESGEVGDNEIPVKNTIFEVVVQDPCVIFTKDGSEYKYRLEHDADRDYILQLFY